MNLRPANNSENNQISQQETEDQEANKENKKITSKIDEKSAIIMCYIFLLVAGLIFYFLEKENNNIRFAAIQSILFGAMFIGTIFMLTSYLHPVSLATNIVTSVLFILAFLAWMVLLFKSFKNPEWEMPFLGKIAREIANKK